MTLNSNKRLKDSYKLDSNSFDSQKFKEFVEFQKFYDLLKKENIPIEEFVKNIEKEVLIPTSIFNVKLSALETICKYMKENLSLSNKKISGILGRDSRSVWQAYEHSKKKHPKRLAVGKTDYSVPASVFADKRLSILENLVTYLKDNYSLSYHQISVILKRDDRTIWTAYNRGLKKNE